MTEDDQDAWSGAAGRRLGPASPDGGAADRRCRRLRREAAEAVGAVNDDKPPTSCWGSSRQPDAAGTEVDGIPVSDRSSSVSGPPQARIIVSTGHPGFYFSRKRIVERLGLPPERYATLIHPLASIGWSVEVGGGTVLLPERLPRRRYGSEPTSPSCRGQCSRTRNVVGDYTTFGSGARLAGRSPWPRDALHRSGALIRARAAHLGRGHSWHGVGRAGGRPAARGLAGVPARRLRKVELPADLGGPMRIPLVDPGIEHAEIAGEVDAVSPSSWGSGASSRAAGQAAFERAFRRVSASAHWCRRRPRRRSRRA